MKQIKRLSINIVEDRSFEAILDEVDEWYHASLLLLDETKDQPVMIQEIHFNEGPGSIMVPNARIRDQAWEKSTDTTLFPYIGGEEKDILPMWNHALRHALHIKETGLNAYGNPLTFGHDYKHVGSSDNCRTGVKALLETMGLTFCDEFTKSTAGTIARGVPIGEKFSFATDSIGIEKSVDKLREETLALATLLSRPSVEKELKPEAYEML